MNQTPDALRRGWLPQGNLPQDVSRVFDCGVTWRHLQNVLQPPFRGDVDAEAVPIPADLERTTRKLLVGSAQAWDDVVWKRACADVEKRGV